MVTTTVLQRNVITFAYLSCKIFLFIFQQLAYCIFCLSVIVSVGTFHAIYWCDLGRKITVVSVITGHVEHNTAQRQINGSRISTRLDGLIDG